VYVEHVCVVGEFGRTRLELTVTVLHEEGVGVGEYFQQTELVRQFHQGHRTEVRELQVFDGFGTRRCVRSD
jgi:hypothetical protein